MHRSKCRALYKYNQFPFTYVYISYHCNIQITFRSFISSIYIFSLMISECSFLGNLTCSKGAVTARVILSNINTEDVSRPHFIHLSFSSKKRKRNMQLPGLTITPVGLKNEMVQQASASTVNVKLSDLVPSKDISSSWPGFDNEEGCVCCEDDCECDHCDVWIINAPVTPSVSSTSWVKEELARQAEEEHYRDETIPIPAAVLRWQREAGRFFNRWKGVKQNQCECSLRQPRGEEFTMVYISTQTYTRELAMWDQTVPWGTRDDSLGGW